MLLVGEERVCVRTQPSQAEGEMDPGQPRPAQPALVGLRGALLFSSLSHTLKPSSIVYWAVKQCRYYSIIYDLLLRLTSPNLLRNF